VCCCSYIVDTTDCLAHIFLNKRRVILYKKCACVCVCVRACARARVTVHATKNIKLLCIVCDLRLKCSVQDRRPALRLVLTGNGWGFALYSSKLHKISGGADGSGGSRVGLSVDTAVFRIRVRSCEQQHVYMSIEHETKH